MRMTIKQTWYIFRRICYIEYAAARNNKKKIHAAHFFCILVVVEGVGCVQEWSHKVLSDS